ncbi:cohesin domain-containing protein [Desulfosudis oleivorans]|uniref:Cohesin domain-containing protein n=1 Tax=Desulfosudis oleivorans (strain DSM 6200 / JCM 39069 / Hxd3) TaxID=96561 RepID=A9A0P5_DESOH|nr:cohesin domain-containing protein [Desulfosudis oleivorans]ABW69062.1 hypothetical protein Dole_3259 [Desulfosudis oleivorans Hxd3]
MKTNKLHKMVQSVLGVLVLGMLIITPAAFADYIDMEYVNADGQVEPAVLTRVNENGYAIGWANQSVLEFLSSLAVIKPGMLSIKGLVCTDVNSPVSSTTVFNPNQMMINGAVVDLEPSEAGVSLQLGPDTVLTLVDWVFIPFDINDDNTMVGGCMYKDSYGYLGMVPFVAEAPWTLPTIILGVNESGEIGLNPSISSDSVSAFFATGINNAGDIIGVMSGHFGSGDFMSSVQGVTFNKAAVEGDGLLSADESSTFTCGGSLLTVPLSINNAGNITGYAFDLKYPLAEGSYLLDLDNNSMLTDSNVLIPAGSENSQELYENLFKLKYLEIKGFIRNIHAADDDFLLVSHVSDQAMAADQYPDTVEVYGTMVYTMLDSDRVLFFYTNVDPDNGRTDEMFTLTDFFSAVSDPDQRVSLNVASLLAGQSSPPNHDMVLVQGLGFPGADLSGFCDINTSGAAVGWYELDGAVNPFIYVPGVCVEENDGYIDIMGRPACVTTDIAPLYVPVRVQASPNDVYALGFEVLYDPNVLEFMGFEVDPADNQYPTTLLAGWQVDGQASWDVSEVGLGLVRVGAYTMDTPIQSNSEGILGYLVFNSFSAEVTGLQIQALVDDIATWDATGACLSQATGDCNDDGVVTPADALCAFEKGLGLCDTSCGPCIEVPSDVDQDGDSDMYDVLCIFKNYLGLPSCLGSGEEPLVF